MKVEKKFVDHTSCL